MPQCPFCGINVENLPSKKWTYSIYQVKLFICSNCSLSFKGYYLNGKLNHLIPKKVSDSEKVLAFLRLNEQASQKQISKVLRLKEQDVANILLNLQKKGAIVSTS